MPFSGKATYDNFPLIGEDVSETMLLISPNETPFLSLLPAPPNPATNIYHQWTEEALGPDRIVASTAVNSATAATGIQINGFGNQLQVGMLLELEPSSGVLEVVQVSSIPGPNSVLVTRNFGSRGVNSLVAGGTLFVISTAELEGSETSGDVTRPRTRRDNYTQIFKKPITISGTDQSVRTAPDVGSEFDHQTTLRTIELARDLEKAVFRSVASGSSIGSSSAYRTMNGLRQFLTGINSTVAANSFAENPILYINDLLQQAWNNGARDLDVIAAGPQWKRDISGTNVAKLQVTQDETGIQRLVEFVQTDFGQVRVLLTPWLPDRYLMGVATSRIRVTPLQGRSFQREMLAKTGDSQKGHIVGEYTLEVHHPDKMFQAHI
jgi:hypothetical protein